MATRSEFHDFANKVVRQWLLQQGFYVVPDTLIDSVALLAHLQQPVLPDLLVAREDMLAWVAIRGKSRATFNQKRRRWETGCELARYQGYLKVQDETRIRGAMAFIHAADEKVHLGFLDELGVLPGYYHGPFKPGHAFKEPMIFFAMDHMSSYSLKKDHLFEKFKDAAVPPQTRQAWEPATRKPPEHKQGYLF
jgi:hypothetical protein